MGVRRSFGITSLTAGTDKLWHTEAFCCVESKAGGTLFLHESVLQLTADLCYTTFFDDFHTTICMHLSLKTYEHMIAKQG
jgi:hypothetical protein